VGRVTNFDNFRASPDPNAEAVLCAELWCDAGDGIWATDDLTLSSLASSELMQAGLLDQRAAITAHHVIRLPRAFPVLYTGFRPALGSILSYVSTVNGLHTIGRLGAHSNDNVHTAIMQGIDLVSSEVTGATFAA
jgi:hypothetical protein